MTRLRAVPIRENGEPLTDPRTLSRRIHLAAKHPKYDATPRRPEVRRSVAEMLALAAERLPGGVDLTIIEGFRTLRRQRFMHQSELRANTERHPEWNTATLHRVTNQISAPPDDTCPPPHTTGGAVDLCLSDTRIGDLLDMTSPFAWDAASAPTALDGLNDTARGNRDLLIQTLERVGLTNYAGEWWHWSYGDSGWALRVGAPCALYDRLAEADE